MPSIAKRITRILFPITIRTVQVMPTLPEARALAALMVDMGKRASIRPAAHGYVVSEVVA